MWRVETPAPIDSARPGRKHSEMAGHIAERDWKVFRELHGIALERMCNSVVREFQKELNGSGSAVEKFWNANELVRKREKEIRGAFDDMRRSTAWLQVRLIRSLCLWTDEEVNRFSPEFQLETMPFE